MEDVVGREVLHPRRVFAIHPHPAARGVHDDFIEVVDEGLAQGFRIVLGHKKVVFAEALKVEPQGHIAFGVDFVTDQKAGAAEFR